MTQPAPDLGPVGHLHPHILTWGAFSWGQKHGWSPAWPPLLSSMCHGISSKGTAGQSLLSADLCRGLFPLSHLPLCLAALNPFLSCRRPGLPKAQLTRSRELPHPKTKHWAGADGPSPHALSPRDTEAQVWPLPPPLAIGAAWWKWNLGAVCSSQTHLPGSQTAVRRTPAHKAELGQAGPNKPREHRAVSTTCSSTDDADVKGMRISPPLVSHTPRTQPAGSEQLQAASRP